jgi:tRNA (Thr-GGU) A37 N-methylase
MAPVQFVSAIHTKNVGRPPEIVAQLAGIFASRRPKRQGNIGASAGSP